GRNTITRPGLRWPRLVAERGSAAQVLLRLLLAAGLGEGAAKELVRAGFPGTELHRAFEVRQCSGVRAVFVEDRAEVGTQFRPAGSDLTRSEQCLRRLLVPPLGPENPAERPEHDRVVRPGVGREAHMNLGPLEIPAPRQCPPEVVLNDG